MDCVNHSGVAATAYCQNCGKPLCASCTRHTAQGQVLCEPCLIAWQQAVPHPFAVPPHSSPNPAVAAALGFIPGVGAMYNGQFLKGFIHVIVFAVLVSMDDHSSFFEPLFGLLTAAWIFYQPFEAYHTAKARREGRPLPDPLGLNEAISNWFHQSRPPYPGQPGASPAGANPTGTNPTGPNPYNPGPPNPNPAPPYQDVYQGSYQQPQYQQPPYQAPYSTPFAPPPPPVPPPHWRRREPIAAIVLIALGVLFLIGQLNILSIHVLHFAWPLLLICLGAWLIARRLHDSQGGPQ